MEVILSAADIMLALRRPQIWGRFSSLTQQPLPKLKLSVEEAWRMGLRAGYGTGMIDGVSLGMEIGAIVAISGDSAFDAMDLV